MMYFESGADASPLCFFYVHPIPYSSILRKFAKELYLVKRFHDGRQYNPDTTHNMQ